MREDVLTGLIFETAMRLHESLDPGEVVSIATECLPSLVSADSWAIFLKSEQHGRLDLVRAMNAQELTVGPFVDLRSLTVPIVRAAVERKTLLICPDSRGRDVSLCAGNGEVLLCVPLLVKGCAIGAVQAARGAGPSRAIEKVFTPEDVRAVESICRSLATALANALSYQRATEQTLIDDLTRLYNVRYLYRALDNEMRRARRYGSPVSIVFMDLDGFKLVNDAYGHKAGSVTLSEVARVIVATVRESDFIARYGGDEFVVLLPETPARSAVLMAERVRERIEAHRFTGGVGADIYLTASFGVASFPEHATQAEQLIELADTAMYEAKMSRKNTVREASS